MSTGKKIARDLERKKKNLWRERCWEMYRDRKLKLELDGSAKILRDEVKRLVEDFNGGDGPKVEFHPDPSGGFRLHRSVYPTATLDASLDRLRSRIDYVVTARPNATSEAKRFEDFLILHMEAGEGVHFQLRSDAKILTFEQAADFLFRMLFQ